MSDRAELETSRAYGLRKRHETRLRRACVFCARIDAAEFDTTTAHNEVVWFEPLNPVTPGHMLFVPRMHVVDASGRRGAEQAALAFHAAAWYGSGYDDAFNLITSAGPAATQTVMHLHIHYVPRRPGDGLALPWTGQARDEAEEALRRLEP